MSVVRIQGSLITRKQYEAKDHCCPGKLAGNLAGAELHILDEFSWCCMMELHENETSGK